MQHAGSHSWEGWQTKEEFEADRAAAGWDGEGSDAEVDYENLDPSEAGEMLAELLIS